MRIARRISLLLVGWLTSSVVVVASSLVDLSLLDLSLDENRLPNLTRDEFYDELGCGDKEDFPIHHPLVWEHLRQIYHDVMQTEKIASSFSLNDRSSAFRVNVTVQASPGRGRGIFAKERIAAGTWVWQESRETTVRFETGKDYRRFLAAVPESLRCDMVEFSYVQDIGQEAQESNDPSLLDPPSSVWGTRELVISIDLEDGAFINGNWDEDENIEYVKDREGGHIIAIRDIEPEEELIIEYDDFAIEDGWDVFGL